MLPTEILTETPPSTTETAPRPTLRPTIDVEAFPCADPAAVGWLMGEYRSADAGNYVLQAGDLIELTWDDAPEGALRYEFALLNPGSGPPEIIGEDVDGSDGVSIKWLVPEELSERLTNVVAYYEDGSRIRSKCFGLLWSGTAPPEGVCSLSSNTAVQLFDVRGFEGNAIGDLLPGTYAAVYERAPDGWFLVDASESLQFGEQHETGWVNERQPVRLHGPCESIPARTD